jgi:hypothetical protein
VRVMHISRLWHGGDKERFGDECPCAGQPCGHVVADESCPQHGFRSMKTSRSMHWADECPGKGA